MANTLINNAVLGEVIGAELTSNLKFAGVAKVGRTLTAVAGDTIKVDKYAYIGAAEDVAEGAEISLSDLTMASQSVTVKKAAKGVKLTDEEVLRRGKEVIDEVKKQLTLSLSDKIDGDVYAAAKEATLTYDGKASVLDYEAIVNATAKFSDEVQEPMAIFINPLQKAQLQLDPLFTRASDMGDAVLSTGVIGEIAGAQVIVSNKVAVREEDGTEYFDNPIVKAGGLGIELASTVNIEEDRSAKTKSSEFYADEHFVAYLRDTSRVVLATVLAKKA